MSDCQAQFLPIFNLPTDLLNLLPIELWAIIFRWKHRLEIKTCLKELIWYRHRWRKEEYEPSIFNRFNRGETWIQRSFKYGRRKPISEIVRVYPKLGIEILRDNVLEDWTKRNIYNHITDYSIGYKVYISWSKEKLFKVLLKID